MDLRTGKGEWKERSERPCDRVSFPAAISTAIGASLGRSMEDIERSPLRSELPSSNRLEDELSQRWYPAGYYQPRSSIRSQPSSTSFWISAATSLDKLPEVRANTVRRSSLLLRC